MSDHMPFIGRKKELSTIETAVNNINATEIIFVHGPGGIGKTRLLEETRTGLADTSARVSEIIDFDDRVLFIPDNLERRIAQQFGEDKFADYMQALHDLRQIETTDIGAASLRRIRQEMQKAFRQDFNRLSQKQRLVLLFDTTDNITRDVWHNLMQFFSQAQNALFVMAGRNGEQLYEEMQHTDITVDVHLLCLQSLQQEKVDQVYLAEKQNQLHMTLDPELAEKVLALAQGRPIMINLAVEWLARDLPADWLIDVSLEELHQHQEAFEAKLVRHITQIRRPLDRLILLLSRVYPLPPTVVQDFLKLEEAALTKVMGEAQAAVFIKILPDGRISLHDEMRRMVNKHIWPQIDPQGYRRRQESEHAITYLEQARRQCRQELSALAAETGADPNKITFVRHEELEQEIWSLDIRCLHHLLFTDLDQGIIAFVQLFDAATQAYRFSLRDNLLDEIVAYQDELNDAQQYEVTSRRARYLFDRGTYQEAKDLTLALLEKPLPPPQQVDSLLLLANLEIRLGLLEKAIDDFNRAVQICRENQLSHKLANALTGLGWAYRNIGDFGNALTYYTEAYVLGLELNNKRETARVLNNMAYVHAYQGNRFVALENCRSALTIWRELDIEREIAITYSTMGEVYRRFAQWGEAQEHYDRALAIFENEDDREWISIVRAGRATIYMRQNNLDKAEKDLAYAADHGPSNLIPRVLHTKGQLRWAQNNSQQAEQLFQRCYDVSARVGDQEFQLRSFADLLDIQWEKGEYENWRDVKAQIEELFDGRDGEEVYRLRGSSLRKLGDLAMCAGAYSVALQAYQEGLPLVAEYEFHEPYAIGQQVRITNQRLQKCADPDHIAQLGRDMTAFWKTRGLVQKSQEALILFYRWQQEGNAHA